MPLGYVVFITSIEQTTKGTVMVRHDGKVELNTIWMISAEMEERAHTYEEALDIAGTGRYHYGLLFTASVSIIAMGIDMFGFSVIVTGCACDFQLTPAQKSILLSMPFLGPILMAYPWGYISDTRGRRHSLLFALWGSFILATLGAFSPNWIVLGVLKFLSTSLCSCSQSATFALLGESCSQKVRGTFMLITTSVLSCGFPVYFTIAYFILNQDYSYDLGWIVFTQWRLLALILTIPLGAGAFCLQFLYESPKFLVNAGQEALALKYLGHIWRINGGVADKYPVKRIVLNEEGNIQKLDESLLKSMWNQTIPLFKPPLLLQSLQLYYLTAVVFGICNSFFVWYPFLAQLFVKESGSIATVEVKGMCNMIISSLNINDTSPTTECTTHIDTTLEYAVLIVGILVVCINLALSKLTMHKKTITMVILAISCGTTVGAVLVADNLVAFILFFGLLFSSLCMGIVFCYFVELYPTSYRGMAACLGVMVARLSALAGINFMGFFVMTHCTATFYSFAAYLFSGVVVSCFLPPDKPSSLIK